MEFDIQKFTNASFQPRTDEVEVPALAPFFKNLPEGETPKWKVRGLTGPELGQVGEAAARNRSRAAIIEGVASGKDDQLSAAIKSILGTDGKVTDDVAKKLEMVAIASVEPTCTLQMAVKFNDAFPIEFGWIVSKIIELTGLGSEVGKPKRSSSKQTSNQHSGSVK